MELRATMLNINKGHNKKLMDACRTLKDYAEYTALVREYARARPLAEAVEKAVDNCISRGVLAEFLKKNRTEAIKVSIYEYDEERHMRQTKEEGFEEGYESGLAEGQKSDSIRGVKYSSRLSFCGEPEKPMKRLPNNAAYLSKGLRICLRELSNMCKNHSSKVSTNKCRCFL